MQSVSSRIWTRIAESTSCDDNHYTMGTSTMGFLPGHACLVGLNLLLGAKNIPKWNAKKITHFCDSHVWVSIFVWISLTHTHIKIIAQSAGAVEYTDCFSAEG